MKTVYHMDRSCNAKTDATLCNKVYCHFIAQILCVREMPQYSIVTHLKLKIYYIEFLCYLILCYYSLLYHRIYITQYTAVQPCVRRKFANNININIQH